MPYVTQGQREYAVLETARVFAGLAAKTAVLSPNLSPGELNYVITRLIYAWVQDGLSYTNINTAMGVLECVKQELYRRVAVPYEDRKREANGDVYHAS
jgi:hypothetical protein